MIGANVRKPLGGVLLIAALAVYAAAVVSFSTLVGRWPVLAQAAFYLLAGVAWVPGLMPLARWIETGRFTRAPGEAKRRRRR